MTGYVKPKKRLHREFLYLNHDTILNSLSAIEAGDVDEIIQKAIDSRDSGLDAGIAAGPARAKAARKKTASVQEELVRTRTNFQHSTPGTPTFGMKRRSAVLSPGVRTSGAS